MGHDYELLSESQLFSLIKEGNRIAFNALYNRYWKRLFAYAYNILNEKELAEDALHDVFIAIWKNRETIEVAKLQNYLFVAVRNKSISLLRKVTFSEFDQQIIENLTSSSEGEENLIYKDLKALVEAAANNLPERCRDIFLMSKFLDYTNSEIASHFKISNRTVENQLSIALKHIRSVITKTESLT